MTTLPHGYKSSPLGPIPQDWKVLELEKLADITMGQSPDSQNYFDYEVGLPLVQGNADIKDKKTIYRIWTNQVTKKANQGDIIMSVRAPVGSISTAMFDCCIGRGVCSIKAKNKTDHFYLYFLLEKTENKWQRLSQGSTFEAINSSDVKSLKLPLPPLPEQTAIASILSTCDENISTTQTLIDRLQHRHKALCQQLLTGKKRLQGFSEKWETIELGDILDYIQPTKYIVESTEYDNKYNTPVLTAGKTFILGFTNEKDGVFTENLPVIIFDDFTTSTQFVNFPFKVKSSAMKILIKKNPQDNMTYIYAAMQQLKYIIGGHERHRISKYAYLTISMPNHKEQDAIASIINDSQAQIDLATAKLTKLKQNKQGLMQQLLTGKTRVPSVYL